MAVVDITNRRHLENIELGKESPFSAAQLALIAERLGVAVTVLYTGEGLRPKRASDQGKRTALVPIGTKTLPLPPVSHERRQELFRERCLRRTTEVAEGRSLGELLEAAREIEKTDWYMTWRTVTKEGAGYSHNVERIVAMAKPWGDIMKAAFLEELHQRFFAREAE